MFPPLERDRVRVPHRKVILELLFQINSRNVFFSILEAGKFEIKGVGRFQV
jgi:hypothetical protein